MMDAGIPLKNPVAGIAMGLIKEGDQFAVLSDILGDEDHLGDMDFKVAGTADGVTSLQMDIKITGITREIMQIALDQAKGGRLHILDEMKKALDTARPGVGAHAPRIEIIHIPTDKIRDVIGPGGAVIRAIVEETGAKIDISDDGTVKIAAAGEAAIADAMARIKGMTSEPEVGHIYKGKVVKVVDFRRLRELLRPQGRARPHLATLRGAGKRGRRLCEGRRPGLCQAARLRRSRQGAPVDEDGRPGDRRGNHEGRRRRSMTRRSSEVRCPAMRRMPSLAAIGTRA